MKVFSLTEARAKFCELVRIAESGEQVCISLRGKPVAILIGNTASTVTVDRKKRNR